MRPGEPAYLLAQLALLIFSVCVHETAHAAVAWWGGDPTARDLGRVTLNPIAHVDPLWSLLVPAVFVASGGHPVGAARPVPINPMLLSRWNYAGAVAAGPLSNVVLALVAGMLLRVLTELGLAAPLPDLLLRELILINVGLAAFNLLPLPPLDGSSVLAAVVFRQPGLGGTAFVTSLVILLTLSAFGILGRVLNPVYSAAIRVFEALGLW
ncbi:MAG: site-2 protease family protein [Planctomycetales bacterium]|nr:site-2 protease family protein [Planctomycetales bacterium]